ncbi:MAG: hypothetical protein CMQ41_02685 [Gammaproteobacteria bacterium]|nr:hypothetical protein [Gammaproteobacteria bacterium]
MAEKEENADVKTTATEAKQSKESPSKESDTARVNAVDKSADRNYLSEFADSAASLNKIYETLNERVKSLNEQNSNLESIVRITNLALKKQRVYTTLSLVIILVGILISTTAVVISASTVGGFSRQFGAVTESMMLKLEELDTGVEYLESNQNSLTALQNGFSEMLVESREGLQQMTGALQVSANAQVESASQLASTITEANQYDYQSLVGLNESMQFINERIVSFENQLRLNEGRVEELSTATQSIDELNGVLQALIVLEQENYLEVLQELLASESQQATQEVQFFRDNSAQSDELNIDAEIDVISEALGLNTEVEEAELNLAPGTLELEVVSEALELAPEDTSLDAAEQNELQTQ